MGKDILTKAKLVLCFLLNVQVFLLNMGCSNPTEMDLQRLRVLEEIYGEYYSFDLSGEFYLEVKSRKNMEEGKEDELFDIYKLFFFDESRMKRRDTTFYYLNWYNHRGRFQYQIFYDPKEKEFKKSKASHL